MRRLMAVIAVGLAMLAQLRAEENLDSANFELPACKTWLKLTEYDIEAAKALLQDGGRILRVSDCPGVVRGIFRTLQRFKLSCPPDGVTLNQVVRMVVNHFEKHPEQLHKDFDEIATAVMIVSWPCPK
jgi:hypothetical protein